jgi:hypothetical protein
MNFRPYTIYKAIGGITVAFFLPSAINVIFRLPPAHGEPAPDILAAIPLALLGGIGLYIFIASDRKIKPLKAEAESKGWAQPVTDWKAILFIFALFFLGLLIFALAQRI